MKDLTSPRRRIRAGGMSEIESRMFDEESRSSENKRLIKF